AEETSTVTRLKDAINAENIGSNKRNALIKEFNSKFGQYLTNLLNEKSTAQDLATAYKEVVKNLRAKMLLEAKEKDMRETVGVRYGWEAQQLADYDKVASEHNTVMNGAWLKAAVDEEYQKMLETNGGQISYDQLNRAVFANHIAPQRVREGYYDTVENQMDTSMGEAWDAYLRQYVSTRVYERRVNDKWKPYEDDINAAIEAGLNVDDGDGGGNGLTPTTDTNGNTDKFKAEKDWKAQEEALNRIAYATGEKNYEQYQQRILAIEVEYQQKILDHTDLTDQERLEAQAAFYEAKRKQTEDGEKRTVEQENQLYNESVALQKQRYIDGEVDSETYQQTLELLELNHLRRMVSLYKQGTNEYIQAQRAYQDRLIADQKKRQQETEALEKKHQDQLKKLKEQYFGDNAGERMSKYLADLEGLKQVYQMEIQAAGDNAKEKLRIEEAYLKAQKALRKQYRIDEIDESKNFLEEWTDSTVEWLQSDMGKAVTGSLEVISSGMSSIFQQLTTLIQAETDIQVAAIEKRYKTEISNAEGNNYQVKKLEKQKEKEIAKVKNDANKKMYTMQVMQAIAQTATAAINAYSSAAAVPVVGWVLAPIAAATAVAAGMLQVAAIKKQQEASQAQGYAEGGFTPEGGKFEVAGVVHKGEWVATKELLQSPVARPMIEALDYAQRTNTIGSLRSEDVSRTIVAPSVYAQSGQQPTPTVIVQSPQADAQTEIAAGSAFIREYADIMRQLKDRLNEPFVTVNTVTGDTGIKQAQDEYDQLIRNKTPKSRRK
ncbi:MAG: phage tail tape measure protein, partial [Prevotella sp.]|nr:phage tail tape measure protein [Prevotella sp.]